MGLKKMPDLLFPKENAVKIKVLPVKQPIGEFYIGTARASEVISICSAKERRKKDNLEEYIGIQRPLNPTRVEEIKKYIKTWDASFPNSVILAINPGYYFFEADLIYIKKDEKSANIIDGQHRLAGFDESSNDFDIILSLFPELELEEQAYLFSVINTKMTRINPSLSKDLLSFSTINTPEKLAHNIAKTFNQEPDNPWYQKIKMLGRKESDNIDPVLSQSTFTKEIINLICDERDAYEIRHILKVNNNDRSSLKIFYVPDKAKRFVFWDAFTKAEDKFIFTVLRDYFSVIQVIYPEDWNDNSKILTKTTGYIGLMKVFEKLVRKGFEEKDLTKEFFRKYLEKAKQSGKVKEFISTNYNPGGMGERAIAKDFLEGMELNDSQRNAQGQ